MNKVSDLGEADLVDRIVTRLGAGKLEAEAPGDDAALISDLRGPLCFTTDALLEGVDFDLRYCSGADVGWKSVAVNASDIAAMGALPRYGVAALWLQPSTSLSLVDDMTEGMRAAAEPWPLRLVGGDISRASQLGTAVSLIGETGGLGPVLRSRARPGDAICVTGSLGGAAAGLRLLASGVDVSASGAHAALAARQLRPEARVEAGRRLAEVPVTAMIDISDGLAVDLWHLTDASRVGCEVDEAALPIDENIARADESLDRLSLAIYGGEDFELLFTLADDRVEDAGARLAEIDLAMTRIGTITMDERLIGSRRLEDMKESGWDHLRAR